MPAGKPSQGNAMLYGLITFVVLFLVSTGLAITFYLKLDDARSIAKREVQQRQQVATDYEIRNIAKIVGKEQRGKSSLGSVVAYFDSVYKMLTGNVPAEEVNIESKYTEIEQKLVDFAQQLNPDAQVTSETVSLIDSIYNLKSQSDMAVAKANELSATIKDMQDRWDLEVEGFQVAENKLLEQSKNFNNQANTVQSNFESMKTLAEKNAQSQISMFKDKLDLTSAQLDDVKSKLQQTQDEFASSEESRQLLEKQLENVRPRPDIELEAFKADAKILSVDIQTGIVYLNVGSCDHAYAGLTFAVFDKNAPLPKDGKGKAEIMIFDVLGNVSAAKIIADEKNNPVITDDIVVNMIWDSKTPYNFYVAGDFDLDGDGKVDPRGREKVLQLIECWGSTVVDKVNVNTDFVVIGSTPKKLPKPTDADTDLDPLAMTKYEDALNEYNQFKSMLNKANAISIPVFDTKRFINLIGYDTEAKMSKAY